MRADVNQIICTVPGKPIATTTRARLHSRENVSAMMCGFTSTIFDGEPLFVSSSATGASILFICFRLFGDHVPMSVVKSAKTPRPTGRSGKWSCVGSARKNSFSVGLDAISGKREAENAMDVERMNAGAVKASGRTVVLKEPQSNCFTSSFCRMLIYVVVDCH